MNNREEENIRNIVTPLASMSIANDKAWLLMQSKVKKMNFLSFGWYHINIYYIAVVGIITFSGAGYAISSLYSPDSALSISKETVPVIENHVRLDVKRQRTDDSLVFLEQGTSKPITIEPFSKLPMTLDRVNTGKDISNEKPNTVNTLDIHQETVISEGLIEQTSEQATESETVVVTKKPVQSRKSIIVEESYDTIVKVDTQYVERRRLFGRD